MEKKPPAKWKNNKKKKLVRRKKPAVIDFEDVKGVDAEEANSPIDFDKIMSMNAY